MLPVFRRFSVGDFPTAPEWLAQVFNPLNTFAETTVATLNENLTIGENVQGLKYSTSFRTDAFQQFAPIVFRYTSGGQPNCCLIGNITKSDGTPILDPVAITGWNLNINTSPFTVNITRMSVLDANTQYNVTFLVI